MLGNAADVVQKVGQAAGLLLELIGELLRLPGIGQRLVFGLGQRIQLFGEFLLLARQLARVRPHLAHLVGELAGALLPQLVAELLQVALGASAFAEGLRNRLLVQCFPGALDFGAGLVELLAGLRHGGLVLGLLHLLLQLVHVGEHLLLFFAQPFEPPADFLAFLVRLGFLQGVLQSLDLFVEVLLALGQFLQAVQDLELFPLFLALLRGGLALCLVAVLGVLQVELLKLLLAGLAAAAAVLAAAFRHQEFVGGQFHQRLVSRFLRA